MQGKQVHLMPEVFIKVASIHWTRLSPEYLASQPSMSFNLDLVPFATSVTLPSITARKTISDMNDMGKYIEISHHMKQ